MKRCTKCGSDGPFHRKASAPDGLQHWCKVCSAESYTRSRLAGRTKASAARVNRRRRTNHVNRIQEMKAGYGCADCEYSGHPAALQFDHVRGEKEFGLARAAMRRWEEIEAEIAKCDVVCANCHAI